ncbi:hypothetical protein ACJRPK_15285 [Aquimarina sp. 2-A2]|uniref:hypothetical protein n=1 Tax=Aquimarina sp. 2-A2 TaxID=3382644 RepID=UPI00387EFBF3
MSFYKMLTAIVFVSTIISCSSTDLEEELETSEEYYQQTGDDQEADDGSKD